MRPSSSTWRSSARLLLSCTALAGALVVLGGAAAASAAICLPPVFEGGRRLVFAGVEVGGIDLLLRQHEVCWRRPERPGERRVFVFGNSGIFGFPHAAEKSAVELINQRFDEDGVPAHLYNLGFVFSYNAKDALILRESLGYEPDLIVFATMLDDFVHVAPLHYPPLEKLFDDNSAAIERFANEEPAGIHEAFARWRDAQADEVRPFAAWYALRDAGGLLRTAVSTWSRELLTLHLPEMPAPVARVDPKRSYKCRETIRQFETLHTDWQEWNPLAYLAEVREQTGAEILVVAWPAAEQPRGRCFNVRYTRSAFEAYRVWIEEQARSRGFHFVDLQDDFPPDEFIDSVHPTAEGQRAIARLLEPRLRELIEAAP